MIKRSFFTGLCVFTYIYLHIKYRPLLSSIEADVIGLNIIIIILVYGELSQISTEENCPLCRLLYKRLSVHYPAFHMCNFQVNKLIIQFCVIVNACLIMATFTNQ